MRNSASKRACSRALAKADCKPLRADCALQQAGRDGDADADQDQAAEHFATVTRPGPQPADEFQPGAAVKTDAEIEQWVRAKCETIYHPVGSCRMGSDAEAVVDPALRVRGIAALRVVDASIFPSIVGGNTNAPIVMVAEKAVDLITGRTLRGRHGG